MTETTETALAAGVITELQRQGWTTYEEVSLGGSQRADIVGTRGPLILVVECKVKRSLALLDQLLRWTNGAHYVIGAHGFSRGGTAAKHFCRQNGFGLWLVGGDELQETVSPRLNRHASAATLRRHLNEAQRTGDYAKAGSNGSYWTPFRQTCDRLTALVRTQPGIELRAALQHIGHHYSTERSALSSIPALIQKGVITTVRVEGRPLRLFPGAAPERSVCAL